MAHYRYRTPALAGPWRDAVPAAVADAIAANQALLDADSEAIVWRDDAHVEQRDEHGGIARFRPTRADDGAPGKSRAA